LDEVHLPIPNAAVVGWSWRVLADAEQFFCAGVTGIRPLVSDVLYLPPLSCALWVAEL